MNMDLYCNATHVWFITMLVIDAICLFKRHIVHYLALLICWQSLYFEFSVWQ